MYSGLDLAQGLDYLYIVKDRGITMKTKRTVILFALLLLFAGLYIAILFPADLHAQDIEDRITEHRLSNGFKVIMLERHSSPTAALYILFKAGGR